MDQVPVTVLTGYLGAGKTTLLNRVLSEQHGKKYAVIVNEFGELGIDNELVVNAEEEVFEMNNGCICCTVRGDLIRIIEGLMKRKGRFDAILIETTGLADPAPVAQTFFVDDEVRNRTKLDSIVTVVDAKNFLQRLEDSHEAAEQVAFADIVLLNKIDLVSPDEAARVEARIRSINPMARLHKRPAVAASAKAWLSAWSSLLRAPALRLNKFSVPITWPRSRSGMAWAAANPALRTAGVNSFHRVSERRSAALTR